LSEKNHKRKIFSSLRWSAIQKVSQVSFSFVVPVILARLLTPEDFGLVAMAAVFTGISSILQEFGTGSAIIQKLKQNIEFQSSVFWFNVLFGFLVWLCIVIAAPYIALLYGQQVITQIIYVSSISIMIQSANIVPVALFKKKMNFFPLALSSIISQPFGAIIAIIMALKGFGYWSLVFYTLFNTLFFTLVLWIQAKWKPKFSFHLSHIKEIIRFSSFLTVTKFLNYFERKADKFIVGYFLGSTSLGLYSRAYNFLLRPTKTISGFLNPVVYSSMSEYQNDSVKIKTLYLESTQALAMVFFPIAIILIIFADPLVNLILGSKWTGIITLVPFFAAILFYKPLHKINPEIFKALGRTDIMFKILCIFTPVIITGFLIGSRFGIIGIGASYTITSFLLFLTSTYLSNKMIKVSIYDIYFNLKNVIIRSVFLVLFYITSCTLLFKYKILFDGITPLTIVSGMIFYIALHKSWPIKAEKNILFFLKLRTFKEPS